MQLRPYQQQCVTNVLSRRAAGVRRQLASLFTAAGKSLIFSSLPQYMPPSQRMMMLVHTKELVVQGAKHLQRWNPALDVGIEMADERADREHQIVVASVQTLGRSDSKRIRQFDPKDFSWLVVDEAHHATSSTYGNVFSHFNLSRAEDEGPTLVGLTATPNRADGQALGQVFDEIVFTYGIKDGIRDGWLVEPKGYRIVTTTDISGVSSKEGDFSITELAKVVNTPTRNDEIVKKWVEYAWPRKTIGFCVDIQHAKDLAFAFQKSGVPVEAIWGEDPRRQEKLDSLRAGRLLGLMNAQLLTEGYDDPSISCVIMARPTKSQTFFVQAIGRALRLDGVDNLENARRNGLIRPDTKVDALILDTVDATGRHSLVTLPSLFGLPAKMDLAGGSVTAAVKAIEEAQQLNPGLNVDKLEDITKLKTYVEEANLFEVHFAEEVEANSQLQWHRASNGAYVLLLPKFGEGKNAKPENLTVFENLLGQFSVHGSVRGHEYNETGFKTLFDAFGFAELNLSLNGSDLMTILRRESKWMKGDVTPAQLRQLKRFRVPDHVIAGMNKGAASKYLATKFGGLK